MSALFVNDGAALILTPIVIAMLRALGLKDKATLAFVMVAGFIADTASLPLVVSNLVNIVSADFFQVGFGDYASVMVPVDLVSIAATLAALLLFFRRDIPTDYDVRALRAPREAIRDAATFRAGWIVLALLLAGFFLLEPLGVPVSAVAAAGAILLLVIAGRGHVIQTGKVPRGAPWQVVIFSLGMYLVVYGLRNAVLTNHLAALLDRAAQGGVWGAALGTGVIAAVLSSVMNNMPTVLVGALSIDAAHATGAVKEAMIYANVIGCDLGPKLTPIGSLATLLWLHVLGQKGVRVGWGYYFRVGVTLTVPVLLITLAALALRIGMPDASPRRGRPRSSARARPALCARSPRSRAGRWQSAAPHPAALRGAARVILFAPVHRGGGATAPLLRLRDPNVRSRNAAAARPARRRRPSGRP